MSLSIATIIPTRNRPQDLARCLRSLQAQRQAPDLVIVCDSSDAEETSVLCEKMAREDSGFCLRYLRSKSRGASIQRNLAIGVLPEDIDYVLLADDDVVFDPEYLALLSGVLSNDVARTIVGIAGVAQEERRLAPIWYRAYIRLFLLGNTRACGKVLASGVNIAPALDGACADADWLFGCALYRREVFTEVRFAEGLRGYSLYDDVDFSMYARALGRLVVCPCALLDHRHSVLARPDEAAFAEMEIVNRYWLVRRHLPAIRNRLAYWWSVVGLLVIHGSRAISRRSGGAQRWSGTLRGLGRVLQSKGRVLE